MKKVAMLLALLCMALITSTAYADHWSSAYGGPSTDVAKAIQQTADGGYVVAGHTLSFGAGSDDAWVLKLNTDGTVAWQKTYGGSSADYAFAIQQTADGGYIVAGSTYSFGAGGDDAWVLKLDADGTVAWQKTYGGANYDYANAIQQTADGGYIVAGSTVSFGAGNYNAWVLKLNVDGTVAWQKTYGGSSTDFANAIQQTADGGYIVAGYTLSFGAGNVNAWVLKLNADGSVAWQKTYGGSSTDVANAIQQTADGGYIVAGYTTSFGAGNDDAWVLKLNADGSVAWQKTYGGSSIDFAKAIQQTADGGYIVAGITSSFGAGNDDAWVLKLNADGSVAWQKTYGGANDDAANAIQQTADGGYIVAGDTISFGAGSDDAWVLKLDPEGRILGCTTPTIGVSSASIANTFTAGVYSTGTAQATTVTATPSAGAVSASSPTVNKSCSYMPSSLKWQKTYGGASDDFANAIQQTADGGYIVAGYTHSFGAGSDDAWVLKLNADGSVAWQKTYGGSSDDVANAIQQTADGGYIVAGYTYSFGAGNTDAWVLKLNADGSVAWQKTYGGSSADHANAIQQTADGGYIVAGYTASFGAGDADAWVLKLNADGSVAWQKTYGGSSDDVANAIQQTADGGYVVAGYTVGAGGYHAWVLKLNADGSVAWQKTYGGSSADYANTIQQTADGGYIVAGYTYSFGAGNGDAWVLKLNAGGSVAWQKTYGGSSADYANAIQQTADGGYVVAGFTLSFGAGGYDAWVLKLNADGSVAWQKTYGGSSDDHANAIQQTADGGYIVAGYTGSFGAGDADAWVLKLDQEGNITGCGTIGASYAVAQGSNASEVISSGSVPNSSVSAVSSSAIIHNTATTPGTQCSASYSQHTLDVYMWGSGAGRVTSSPPGIDCISDCRGTFHSGTLVTLRPTVGPGFSFGGWEGACDTAGHVTLNNDEHCIAVFNSNVDFEVDYRSGLAPLTVAFTDLSNNSPTSWSWFFGDGGSSLLQNPSNEYLFPGVYTVKLTATGSPSGTMTKEDYITVTCNSGTQGVRLGTPPSTWTGFDSIFAAYAAASTGNYIEPMSVEFPGDLVFNQNKVITLRGGYNCDYSSNAAFTTISGKVTIGGPGSGTGKVTIENIVIR